MRSGDGSRYRRRLALAGAALFWEDLWPRLWPLVSILGLFLAVSLLGVLPRLPGWLHLLVLVGFAVAALAAAVCGGRNLRLPGRVQCRRRLEIDSGLSHRPLGAREDDLAAGAGDPVAEGLWSLHQQRMAAAAKELVVKMPSPGLPRLEPWGIRAGIVLLLVIGFVIPGGSVADRLRQAVSPALAAGAAQPLLVEVWITPPAYTGLAPIFLKNGPGDGDSAPLQSKTSRENDASDAPQASRAVTAVAVPQGSRLLAQVSGVRTAPLLVAGDTRQPLAALAEPVGDTRASAFRAETTIDNGERLEVRLGSRLLAAWPIRVVADGAPAVAFAKPPEAVGNGQLAIAYTAADDYGLSALTAEIRPDLDAADTAGDELIRLDLPVPAAADGVVSAQAKADLAAHRWAGARVNIRLEARDALGQTGNSDEISAILPERTFKHPVAQAIVSERKRLRALVPSPDIRAGVAANLDAIARRPGAYGDDVVVTLALSVARARLLGDAGDGAVETVRSLLWATALHLDEGEVPRAERSLAEARAKLLDALEAKADEAEIDQLVDALEQALAQYLQAVAAELARRGGLSEAPFPAETVLGGDELRDLVEMAREMARAGARDGARELLDRLQAMLEGIRGGLDHAGNREDLAEAGAIMQELRDLAADQQQLLDETYARYREQGQAPADLRPKRPDGGRGEASAGLDATESARQKDLRRQLGALMSRLDTFTGTSPPSLGAADRAMGDAGESLETGRLGDATDRQGEAVQALRESLQGAGQAMAQRLGAGMALFSASGRGGDPFGRTPGEQGRGLGIGDVKIPERGEVRRAGEILEELRRRAGERQRPEAELDYIERLLRQF